MTLAPTTAPPIIQHVFNYDPIQYIRPGQIDVGWITIEGTLLNQTIFVDPIEVGPIDILGSLNIGVVHGAANTNVIEVTLNIVSGGMFKVSDKRNWVRWSKIGYLDFTIDQTNLAGEKPLDWKGGVHKLLKLGKAIVAYGENGVSILTPSQVSYGHDTIHRIGILCQSAAIGTDSEHYFIDKTNQLYKLSMEGLKLLDYSEYLSQLTNPVMALDTNTGLLYICDATYGYVFSTKFPSFGQGPEGITGIGVQDSNVYVVSPSAIVTPKFDITTDIYDLGTRKAKTIRQVEVGTDLTEKLELQIYTRLSNRGTFITSRWALVNPSGVAHLPCYGYEFKFRLRSRVYEYLELDYLKIIGDIHGFSMMEGIE